jgi:hypothetical protein
MKRLVVVDSWDDLSREYPLDIRVPGWRFRVQETSPGAYLAEGRDRAGRTVSHQGGDADSLLHDCGAAAKQVLRGLTDFIDNDELYASVQLLCDDLSDYGLSTMATSIRDAMRAGSTAGEVLGGLREALWGAVTVKDAVMRSRASMLLATLDRTLDRGR